MPWVNVKMDAGLKARVDAVRGDVPLSRWLARAVEARLGDDGPPYGHGGAPLPMGVTEPPRVHARELPRQRPVDDAALARQRKLNAGKGL